MQAGLVNEPATTGLTVTDTATGAPSGSPEASHFDSFFDNANWNRDDFLVMLAVIQTLVVVAMWRDLG